MVIAVLETLMLSRLVRDILYCYGPQEFITVLIKV
jgi:hypothetical protein